MEYPNYTHSRLNNLNMGISLLYFWSDKDKNLGVTSKQSQAP